MHLMIASSSPLPIDSTIAKTSWFKSFRAYIVLLVCSTLYLIPFMRLLLLGTDEGLLVSGAVRVAHGQVFARDFVEIVGPGSFYWLALFFKLFGVTFAAERICLFVSSLGTAFAIYFLTRRVCDRYRLLPLIILTGTYFGMLWPTISHHVDSNCCGLLAVIAIVFYIDVRSNGLLFAAGILAGATTIFHQPKGLLLLCVFIVWLLLQRRRQRSHLASVSSLVGGYTVAIGIMIVYFWSQHALGDLINANYIWPASHYGPTNIVPYAQGIFVQYWVVWASSRTALAIILASMLIIPFLFIAVLPVLLPLFGAISAKSLSNPEILLFWLSGCAMWIAEIHRKDIQHLTFGSPLLIILAVYYLGRYRTKLASLLLQTLAISATCLTLFNLLLVLTAHPFATKAGDVRLFKDDPAITFLDQHARPGQEIFVYPYSPMYYFLSATTNPTRWSGLGYNYNSPADFQGVVQILDQHRVRFVVWDTLMEERSAKFSPSMKLARPEERILEPYFESHYKMVWEQNGVRIMERNSDAPMHS